MAKKPVKPRSLSAKKSQAEQAWQAWQSGTIDAYTRDDLAKPYLNTVGLSLGMPDDVERVRALAAASGKLAQASKRSAKAADTRERSSAALFRKAESMPAGKALKTQAKAEKLLQEAEAFKLKADATGSASADLLKQASIQVAEVTLREQRINDKLAAGELKIFREMEASIASGKKTYMQRDESATKWREAAEHAIRDGMAKQAAKLAANPRKPGVPWKGGTLRSGSMAGQKMSPAFAIFELVNKYVYSSMPANGIVPNLNIRGDSSDGDTYVDKVPIGILDRIGKAAMAAPDAIPDTSELEDWVENWIEDRDIEEIDLFADDADMFLSGPRFRG